MLHDPKREAQIAEQLFEARLEPWQTLLLDTAAFFRQHPERWARSSYALLTQSYPNLPVYNHCCIGGMRRVAEVDYFVEPVTCKPFMKARLELTKYLACPVETWNDAICDDATDAVRALTYAALG